MAFDFILMLTANDQTIPDAAARLEEALEGGVRHIGFKDVGLPVVRAEGGWRQRSARPAGAPTSRSSAWTRSRNLPRPALQSTSTSTACSGERAPTKSPR